MPLFVVPGVIGVGGCVSRRERTRLGFGSSVMNAGGAGCTRSSGR